MAKRSESGIAVSTELEQTDCPLCGCGQSDEWVRGRDLLYGSPGEFSLRWCRRCRHGYVSPRPTLEAIGDYYPSDYAPYHLEGEHQPKPPRGLRRWARQSALLRRFVLWFVDPRAEYFPPVSATPKRALELGCADGRFLEELRNRGWDASGVELSPAPADVARNRGFSVHVGSLESAALEEGSFDAIFAWMVIEHLHDPVATLHEMHRLLKPSGWLAFCVPNFGCWEPSVFGRNWYALHLPCHLQHFTSPSIGRLLDDTGFERVKTIHQRNLNNVVGSAGLCLREWSPNSRLAERLIRYPDDPNTLGVLSLAPLAKLLAWCRQAGRLTVVARRR